MPLQLDTTASGDRDITDGSVGGDGKNVNGGGSDGGLGNGGSRLCDITYGFTCGHGSVDRGLQPIPPRKRGILG